jgi:hypothetical protein
MEKLRILIEKEEVLEIKELVEEVIEYVSNIFSKWSIVGSIMRGHADYHDLDFLILDEEVDLIDKIPNSKKIFESDQRVTIIYKNRLQVDFFISPRESWELGRIAWGYGKANLHLRRIAKDKGCKLNQYVLQCGQKFYHKLEDVERILDYPLPEYLKKDVHSLEHVDEESIELEEDNPGKYVFNLNEDEYNLLIKYEVDIQKLKRLEDELIRYMGRREYKEWLKEGIVRNIISEGIGRFHFRGWKLTKFIIDEIRKVVEFEEV